MQGDQLGGGDPRAGHPGNLLIDSPRWTRFLAEPFEAMGGIDDLLLTHRDDVADASRWSQHFGARVWIHADADPAPFATDLLEGGNDTDIGPGLLTYPSPATPGAASPTWWTSATWRTDPPEPSPEPPPTILDRVPGQEPAQPSST